MSRQGEESWVDEEGIECFGDVWEAPQTAQRASRGVSAAYLLVRFYLRGGGLLYLRSCTIDTILLVNCVPHARPVGVGAVSRIQRLLARQ